MKPLSIRSGLTAWFVGLTLLLLAVFSVSLFASVRGVLHSGLDARLASRANGLAVLCEWDEDVRRPVFELRPEIAERLARNAPGSGESIHVWPTRKLLHRVGEEIASPVPEVSEFAGALGNTNATQRWSNAESDQGRRRICESLVTIPSYVDDEGHTKREFAILIRVSEDLGPVEAELASLGGLVALLAALTAVVALVFATLISRRVVRPLRDLGEAAAAIRAGRSVSIPLRGTADEVDQLGEHLESAFTRLDDALQRQTRFTSDASHELRNPITAIRSSAEVALRRDRSEAEYRRFLQEILGSTERMGQVVESLLMLARADRERDAARHEPVDLVEVARAAANGLPEGKSRVHVVADRPTIVNGDPTLLRVLTDNLIGNALRYSGRDDPVTVTLSSDGGPTVAVEDRGPGVPESERGRVFERFYRGAAAAPGSNGAGLGLALVSEIARVHRAHCEMESTPGRTCFRVRFPEPTVLAC